MNIFVRAAFIILGMLSATYSDTRDFYHDQVTVHGMFRVIKRDTLSPGDVGYVWVYNYVDSSFALFPVDSLSVGACDSTRAAHKADISDTALVALNLPLHQHDSLYHRKPEFINGTLDLHLDSVTLRVIKLTGLPSGYTGDSCLILKNGVPSIISASSYRVMIGAAPALHQHDSLYFREYELKNGHTNLYLDSLAVYKIVAKTEIVSEGNLYVDYDAYITDDLEVGDDFKADSISVRTERLYGASYYVPPVGEQWAMDCMLGLKDDLIYKLSSSEALSFAGAAPASHTHDDRYYTETEIGTLFYTKPELYTKTELGNGTLSLRFNDLLCDDSIVGAKARISGTHAVLNLEDQTSVNRYGLCGTINFGYKPVAGPFSVVSSIYHDNNELTLSNPSGTVVIDGDFTVKDRLVVGSVGGLTTTTGMMYGSTSPVFALVDTDAGNNTEASLYMGFYCSATDSLIGYVGYGSVSNTHLYLINRTASGNLIFRTNNTDRLTIASNGNATFAEDLTADSVSGRVVKVPGDTSYSVTVTLKDGATSRGTGTAYIAKDAQRRIAYISVPTKTGTITASTTTTLSFPSNTLPDPVNGATVITGPLVSNSNDIAGVLWVKNNDIIELHSTNPWGYLAAGTGGVTNTDFSYRY